MNRKPINIYQTPYTMTPEILNRVAAISEAVGRLSVLADPSSALRYCFSTYHDAGAPEGDNPIIACQHKNKYLLKLAGYNCPLILGKLHPPAIGLFLAFGEFSQWQIPYLIVTNISTCREFQQIQTCLSACQMVSFLFRCGLGSEAQSE